MVEASVQHRIGCAQLPPGMSRAKYFEKLNLLEIDTISTGEPKRKAVRAWREKTPESGAFSVIAHKSITETNAFSPTEQTQDATKQLADYCEILRAEAVVFATPPGFTPSAQNRDNLRRYFAECGTAATFGTTQRVWAPEGLWEPETVAAIAEKLDLLVAIDPLAPDPFSDNEEAIARHLSRDRAYLRILGLGGTRSRFHGYQLEALADMLGELDKAWVVFGHTGKYPDALALRRLLD